MRLEVMGHPNTNDEVARQKWGTITKTSNGTANGFGQVVAWVIDTHCPKPPRLIYFGASE